MRLSLDDIAATLKIPPAEIVEKNRIMLVNAGLAILIVPLVSLDTLLALHPDQKNLREFCLVNNIEIILVFTREVSLNYNNYRTQVFAPVLATLKILRRVRGMRH